MTFCLLPRVVEDFKKALVSGEIDPLKLSGMDSAGRREFLTKYVGKDAAPQVNALFESKILLKNQKAGYISWAKKISGIAPEIRKDLLSKIERLDTALSPEDEKSFLNDLVATKLGVEVKPEDAKAISGLAEKVKEGEALRDSKTKEFKSESDRLSYGAAKVELANYVNSLKEEALKPTLKENLNPIKAASNLSGFAKSVKASLDDSALFRQGWRTIWTNPLIWKKNALTSISDMIRTLGNKEVMNGVMADIVSRPNYDLMTKAKLAIGNIEDTFPSTLPEKIFLFGRVYKASEVAYTAFLYRTRADIFDRYVEMAKNADVNLKDVNEVQSIGKLVNSLTGRGDLGPLEKAGGFVNNVFFSLRNVKSQFDTLTVHATDTKFSSFARKQAAVNLVKVLMGTASVLAIAKAFNPSGVETDPRSSDFGKIKVGDTRFDVSGGMASLVTLASRIITQSSKSSSGIVKPLNTGEYGSQTTKDVVYNFFENKLSPAASIVKDLLTGKDFQGNPLTFQGEVSNLLMPLPITTFQELQSNPNSAPTLLAMLADSLGIATNTYPASSANWNNNITKEHQAFKKKVGNDTFIKANNTFNKKYNDFVATATKSDYYKKLSDEKKKEVLDGTKKVLENEIMKSYDFKYKRVVSKHKKK